MCLLLSTPLCLLGPLPSIGKTSMQTFKRKCIIPLGHIGKVHIIDGFLATDRYLLAGEKRREVKINFIFSAKTCFGRRICLLVRCNITKDLIR